MGTSRAIVVAILLCTAVVCHAQIYAGGSLGISYQDGIGDDHIDRSACASYRMDRNSTAASLFAGYRYGYIGAEVGAGKLFHSTWQADCPAALGTQDIKAVQSYWRLQAYVPLSMGFEIVPFFGQATVRFTNYEVGDYREPYLRQEHATNLTTGRQHSMFYGFGLQREFGSYFARVEAQRMEHVAEDLWTARGWHNNVQTLSFGIGYKF